MTTRVLPTGGTPATTVANGRSYSSAAGAQDVPDQDAAILGANKWIAFAPSGPTSARPTIWPPNSGTRLSRHGLVWLDTTLSLVIVFNGLAWIDPATGNVV